MAFFKYIQRTCSHGRALRELMFRKALLFTRDYLLTKELSEFFFFMEEL